MKYRRNVIAMAVCVGMLSFSCGSDDPAPTGSGDPGPSENGDGSETGGSDNPLVATWSESSEGTALILHEDGRYQDSMSTIPSCKRARGKRQVIQ